MLELIITILTSPEHSVDKLDSCANLMYTAQPYSEYIFNMICDWEAVTNYMFWIRQ